MPLVPTGGDIPYFNLRSLDLVDVRSKGADPTGAQDSYAAFNLAAAALSSTNGILSAPSGIYKLSAWPTMPNLDSVRIVGGGRYGTTLDLRTATGGVAWSGAARREGIRLEHLTIQGKLTQITDLTNAAPGTTNDQVSSASHAFVNGEVVAVTSGTNVTVGRYIVQSVVGSGAGNVATLDRAYASGASTNGHANIYPGQYIGLDFNEVDESSIYDVQITGWDTGLRIRSSSFGAYFTDITHPRIVNCARGAYLTGTNGANESHFSKGHIDNNLVGVLIDTPTDGTRLDGTGFQANLVDAIQTAGKRGMFTGCRFEGNTHDVTFQSTSAHNVLETGFLDNTKITDLSTTKSNRIRPYGHATTVSTDTPQTIMSYDWRMITNTSKVIGVQFGSVSHRFQVYEGRWVTGMNFEVSVQAGNIDCAIVDAISAVVVASSGPVALGTANARQTVNFASAGLLYPGGTYYMCVLFDDATAGLMGFTLDTPAQIMTAVDKLVVKKTMANNTIAGQNLIAGASTGNFMYAIQVV